MVLGTEASHVHHGKYIPKGDSREQPGARTQRQPLLALVFNFLDLPGIPESPLVSYDLQRAEPGFCWGWHSGWKGEHGVHKVAS